MSIQHNHLFPLASRAFVVIIFILLSALGSVTLAKESPKYGYDVSYYELKVEISLENKMIQGEVNMHFSALTTLKTVRIDLYKNLKIDAILYDTLPLKYQRQDDVIFIQLNQEMTTGDRACITVQYHGSPLNSENPPWQGGFVWRDDRYGNPWVGVVCQTSGASIWWPVKEDHSDEPDSMLLQFTIPMGLICISNGQLIQYIERESSQVFVWKTQYPINVYNVTFYIGAYYHFSIPYPAKDSNYRLDFFVLEDDLEKAVEHFQQTVPVMRFFEKTFGEYPWWQEGYKLIESPYAGVEHQTAIAYGYHFQNIPGFPFDYTIVHETAHEWWGNSVTAGDFRDIWLHEGIATYCEALFAEEVGGYETYMRYIEHLRAKIFNHKPLTAPTPKRSLGFQRDVYTKGAWLLHTLRLSIGDDSVFFDILKTFYQENRYSITSTEKFIEVVNRKSGKEYRHFFDLYLNKVELPLVEWNFIRIKKEDQFKFYYQLKTKNDSLFIPFQIKIYDTPITLHASKELRVFELQKDTKIEVMRNNSYAKLWENRRLKPPKKK